MDPCLEFDFNFDQKWFDTRKWRCARKKKKKQIDISTHFNTYTNIYTTHNNDRKLSNWSIRKEKNILKEQEEKNRKTKHKPIKKRINKHTHDEYKQY